MSLIGIGSGEHTVRLPAFRWQHRVAIHGWVVRMALYTTSRLRQATASPQHLVARASSPPVQPGLLQKPTMSQLDREPGAALELEAVGKARAWEKLRTATGSR